MHFVLDNSVAMRWLLRDGSPANQQYATDVLASMATQVAAVPPLWWLELANVIARSERRQLVPQAESEQFLQLLASQAIEEKSLPSPVLLDKTVALSRQHGLSSYDANYLVLAMHLGVPLATLDADLRRTAQAIGVPLHLTTPHA